MSIDRKGDRKTDGKRWTEGYIVGKLRRRFLVNLRRRLVERSRRVKCAFFVVAEMQLV
jgi:hypothetical protein